MARIGIDPKPPAEGTVVTLTAGPNMKLRIEVDPNGVFEVETDANGEATYEIPTGAALMIVSDPKGVWRASSTAIQ